MTDAATRPAADRHYGMDWLRIGAFALLILYHVGMFYVPWDWHVKSDPVLWWATIPMFFTNAWRLSLLFLVSGYASAAMLAKRPAVGAFLKNRTARLLVPLVFGMMVIVPPQPWVELQFKHGYSGNFLHFWASDYFRFGELYGIKLPTWQHLWFVAYLWPYTLLLGALLYVPNSWRTSARRVFEAVFSRPLLLLALPVGWLALRSLVLFPGQDESHALFDDFTAHAEYLPAFLFGFALQRASGVWQAIGKVWRPALLLAMASYAVVAGIEWTWPGDTRAPDGWVTAFWLARAVNAWCMIVALLGIAARYWNHDHPARATLNEAIFPFYIVHQTIIVVAAWFCLKAGIPNLASFPLLVAATAGGCWLFYRIGREVPVLRQLIGLRGSRPPHRQAATLAA